MSGKYFRIDRCFGQMETVLSAAAEVQKYSEARNKY